MLSQYGSDLYILNDMQIKVNANNAEALFRFSYVSWFRSTNTSNSSFYIKAISFWHQISVVSFQILIIVSNSLSLSNENTNLNAANQIYGDIIASQTSNSTLSNLTSPNSVPNV